MNKQQLEVLNTVQQVMKCLLLSILSADRAAARTIASALQASTHAPGLSATAVLMLQDLALGVSVVSSAGKKQH